MMVRYMVVIGFIATLLAGCSSGEHGENDATRMQLGADVELTHAQQYRQVAPLESFPSPPGKGRYRFVIHSDSAVTFEQRAQTAMKAAMDFAKGNAYEVQVWLEREPEKSERVAVADYYPYGEMAYGRPAANVWDVRAADTSGQRGAPDWLAPYFSTKPSDYSH